MHVIAQDIDSNAVHMTYIQLALLHVPVIVIHGNSLDSEKTWGHWVTPTHVWGFWDSKLCRAQQERAKEPETDPSTEAPTDQETYPIMEAARTVITQARLEQNHQLSLFV